MAYVKLDCDILDSSLWVEDLPTRVVFITMLAMADSEGVCRATAPGIARRGNIPVADVRNALIILESPDPDSRTQTDEGRRIRRQDGGYRIVNYTAYRDKDHTAAARMRRYRENQRKQELNLSVTRNERNGDVTLHKEKEKEKEKQKEKQGGFAPRPPPYPPPLYGEPNSGSPARGTPPASADVPPAPPPLTPARQTAPKRATPRKKIPGETEFPLSAGMIAYLEGRAPGADPVAVWERFRSHHESRGSLMADWAAAWRYWCGNEAKYGPGNGTAPGRPVKFDAGEYLIQTLRKDYEHAHQDSGPVCPPPGDLRGPLE